MPDIQRFDLVKLRHKLFSQKTFSHTRKGSNATANSGYRPASCMNERLKDQVMRVRSWLRKKLRKNLLSFFDSKPLNFSFSRS